MKPKAVIYTLSTVPPFRRPYLACVESADGESTHARNFASPQAAIDYCLNNGATDVRCYIYGEYTGSRP